TWLSGSTIATVLSPSVGLISGQSPGNTTIFYIVNNNNGCAASVAQFPFTVNASPNGGTISGPTSVCVGHKITLSTNGDQGGMWISGTPAVATVNPTTGEVTGVTLGNPTIFYS